MYKITLLFQSNIPNVYSQEVEIATDEDWLDTKIIRMLDRWGDNLSLYSMTYQNAIRNKDIKVTTHLIQKRVMKMNEADGGNRSFEIKIEDL